MKKLITFGLFLMVSAAAFGQTVLPRTGWTATCSDTASTPTAAVLVNGSANDTLGSQWYSTASAYPHYCTVDRNGDTSYFNGIRVNNILSGYAGYYNTAWQVYFSDDNVTWGSAVGTLATPGAQSATNDIRVPYNNHRYFRVAVTAGTGLEGNYMHVQSIYALSYSASYTVTVEKTGSGTGTITSNDGHINCGATCTYTWPSTPATITLTAVNQGRIYAITNWTRCDSSTGLACTLNLPSSNNAPWVNFNDVLMTSDSAPSPLFASATTAYDGFASPYEAFDGSIALHHTWAGTNGGVDFLKLDIGAGNAKGVGSYKITNGDSGSFWPLDAAPKNWTLEGSSDNSAWTVLDTRTNETGWAFSEERTYSATAYPFRYFRLNITANNGNGSGHTSVGELKLLEGTPVPLPNGAAQPIIFIME